jgi:hypothetical protein
MNSLFWVRIQKKTFYTLIFTSAFIILASVFANYHLNKKERESKVAIEAMLIPFVSVQSERDRLKELIIETQKKYFWKHILLTYPYFDLSGFKVDILEEILAYAVENKNQNLSRVILKNLNSLGRTIANESKNNNMAKLYLSTRSSDLIDYEALEGSVHVYLSNQFDVDQTCYLAAENIKIRSLTLMGGSKFITVILELNISNPTENLIYNYLIDLDEKIDICISEISYHDEPAISHLPDLVIGSVCPCVL